VLEICSSPKARSETVRVQVLGLLESAGIGFDALGERADRQRLAVALHGSLPAGAAAAEAGVPEASARNRSLDRRLTEGGWARRRRWSSPGRGRRGSRPDSQFPDCGIEERPVAVRISSPGAMRSSRSGKTEEYTDESAPSLKDKSVKGHGILRTRRLPVPRLRAHRLRAEQLDSPSRAWIRSSVGNLVHC
jgi:hypothetical protein